MERERARSTPRERSRSWVDDAYAKLYRLCMALKNWVFI
jgi:hypothetical protein